MKSSFWRRWVQSVRGAKQTGRSSGGALRRRILCLETLDDRTLLSGTPALVLDINPGLPQSYPTGFVVIGSMTYFSANDGIHGRELWKSDGTAAGTTLVADIWPGPNSNLSNLTNVNGTLFFAAEDGTHGLELWKSDGTAAGTVMVKDINPGSAGSIPRNLTNVNGTLFFSAYSGGPGAALWKSDGTTAGTVFVRGVNPVSSVTNVNGTLFFAGDDGTHGVELWKSDGTTAGTTLVKDIFPGTYADYFGRIYPNSSGPSNLTNFNGTLFFSAEDGTRGGAALWKSDGTAAGTVLFKDVANPSNLTNLNGTLFFSAGGALWKSDGTAAGTVGVYGVNPVSSFTNVNGTLFFAGDDGTHGVELWKSDGTTAGTTLVKDIFPGAYVGFYAIYPNSSHPSNLTNVNGTLFFSAEEGTHGRELWQSDGTAAGTVMVQDINPGSASSGSYNLTNANGTLFFTADDGVHGYELWKFSPASSTPTAASLAVSGFPASTTAGTAVNFTITAKNANGTTATGYTGTMRFSSTDPLAGLPANYTFTTADAGVHTFSATLKTAGTQSITATDTMTASITGTQAGIVVNPAAASQLSVSAPASSTAGSAFSVTVTARDAYNNAATGYTGTAHFTSTDAAASSPGNYTFTAADAGVHVFTNGVILKTAGSQTITATDTVTASVTGGAAVAVSPAAANTLTAAGFPSAITAGVAGNFTVTLKDLYGNVATGYLGTVAFSSSDGKAALPANYTFTAADAGVHTFRAILKTAGTQSITVKDTVTASLTGTDSGITVKAGAATQFILTAPSSVTAGAALSLTISVQDAYGNVVTGYTGTVHFTSTDSTATLPANYTFKAADNGVHTFTGLVLRKKGSQKITVTDTLNSSLTGSVIESVL